MKIKPILWAMLILGGFAVIGSGLASFIHYQTLAQIKENEYQALLSKLHTLVPHHLMDNDMVKDQIQIKAPELGAAITTVYRARYQKQPVAAVFTPVVPDGYAGEIRLLVAVKVNGELGGVRVISHQETPGLGDRIEEKKSDWILTFKGKSLTNPPLGQWHVKKDGGVFDQFTGATITPRSIVKMVKTTLLYYQQHAKEVFQ